MFARALCLVIALALLPAAATAEPIKLKLSFFSSDRSMSYLAAVKPFVDAVNTEARGLFEIDVSFSDTAGKDIALQPQFVLDGKTDIAFIVPGYTPAEFPDNTVIELPGLFRGMREATLVYTRLVALGALRGYSGFVVIGAYVTEPETIHGREAINSIDDLRGKKIRINNPSETAALEKLGATPVLLQINRITDAISSGKIDAAAVSMTPLADYGIKRVAIHHYILGTNGAPLALIMNKKRFEALPKAAQDIIRKYSGEWAARRFIETYSVSDQKVLEQLKSDPKRTVIFPSASDLDVAHRAFSAVVADWAAKSQHNRDLLGLARKEVAALRSSN